MNMTCPHCGQVCFVSVGMQNTHVRCPHQGCRAVFYAGVRGNVAVLTIPLRVEISFGGSVDIDGGGRIMVKQTADEPPTEYVSCNHRCGHNPNRS